MLLAKSATSSNASRPRSSASCEGQPDRRSLGLGVGRPGQRAVVGHHRLAERHADRDLALVVRLVGVQLRSRRVADDPQAVGQPQPPVARERRPPGRVDAVVLEPQVVERERAPDREQDDMALGGRAVVEVDDVGAVLARRGPRSERPDAGPDRHAVGLERGAQDLGIARVVGRREARPGLDDRRRDAETGIDLGQLAAGRAATEDDQAARQLAGQRRLLVGPGDDLVEPLDGRPLGDRADGDDDVRAGQLVGHRRRGGRRPDHDRRSCRSRGRRRPPPWSAPPTCELSSGSGASAARLIMKSRWAEARGHS